jgi:hypothetical protein
MALASAKATNVMDTMTALTTLMKRTAGVSSHKFLSSYPDDIFKYVIYNFSV